MKIMNQYIYEEKSLILALIEVLEYCEKNEFKFKRLNDTENNYRFTIDLNLDINVVLEVTIKDTKNEHQVVTVDFDVTAKHQKITEPVAKIVEKAVGLVVGGVSALSSIVTPGIGWILGSTITAIGYGIGSIPGKIVGGVDDSISKMLINGCEKHFISILNLFNDNLVDLTGIMERAEQYKDGWLEHYLKETGKTLFTFTNKEENEQISFNYTKEEKKTVKLYTLKPGTRNTSFREIKKKEFQKGTVDSNKNVVEEVEAQWISFCVDPVYEEEFRKRTSLRSNSSNMDVNELKKKLKSKMKY